MKTSLLILFAFLIVQKPLFAQFDAFDLSEYKLPDIKRKRLDLRIDFAQYSRNIKNKTETLENSETFSHLSNSTNLSYYSFANTAKYQGNQTYTLGFSPEFEKEKNDDGYLQKSGEVGTSFSVSSENRFYLGKLFFLETDINTYGNYTKGKISNDPEDSETVNENYTIYFAIPLMVGLGRIEPIQDARLAIYIFDELNKLNRMLKIPSNEEILEFSRLISELKNERYFDYRLKRIIEIEKVDSFLQTKGLISKADAAYFTSVYDNWEYSSGPYRESGVRLYAGFSPVLYRNQIYSRTEYGDSPLVNKSDGKYNDYKVQFIAGIRKETPLNLYWQQTMGMQGNFDLNNNSMRNKVFGYEREYSGKLARGSAYYELGYYPNSRTNLNAGIQFSAQYEMNDYKSEPEGDTKRFELYPWLFMELDYYISPQLRLHVNFALEYIILNYQVRYFPDTEYDKTNTKLFNQDINLSFTYSIF